MMLSKKPSRERKRVAVATAAASAAATATLLALAALSSTATVEGFVQPVVINPAVQTAAGRVQRGTTVSTSFSSARSPLRRANCFSSAATGGGGDGDGQNGRRASLVDKTATARLGVRGTSRDWGSVATQKQRPGSAKTALNAVPKKQGEGGSSGGRGRQAAGGGGGRGESGWRRIGDVPALVVGVGFLVSRHRRELREKRERRQLSSSRTEDAAVAARVGLAGAAATGVDEASRRAAGGAAYGARDARRKAAVSSGVTASDRDGDAWELEEEEEEEGYQGGRDAAEELAEVEEVTQERQRRYRRDGEREEGRQSERRLTTCTSLDISLDRSVMPEPIGPFVVWGTAIAALLGVVAVVARIPRVLGVVGSTVTQTVEPAYKHSQLPAVVGDVRYKGRLLAGSLRAWASRRSEAWERTFGPEEEILPGNDWSVCTLLERNREGGNVLRYRFGLQGSPNTRLPLELGQELTLCGLDSSNKVVHGNYVPLTPRKQRGYLDIVVRRDSAGLDDGLGSTRSDREFSRYLDNLPVGDEIAVKPGREGLAYAGPYSPITDLVLIATGLGIVPMIQMVTELLPSRDSSVSSASVIWLNEKAEDFALYGELEKAFFRNHRKLDVSCIVERDLFGHHLDSNAMVREAAPEFKIGTLAAVAGPEFFTRKVTDYLMHKGYPEEVIIEL